MAYENLGGGALDYLPCRYGNSKILFRGPKRKLDKSFVAMLGGTETYGRFMETPFPALAERALNRTCVNLGCVNAGTDVFAHDQAVMDICHRAAAVVIQLPGAQNVSNRFYSVHPRRNDRFLRASNLLKTIYREIDFTDFNFTRHLLTTLKQASADKFALVEDELKEAWVARMKTLIARVETPVVLLWMGRRAPGEPSDEFGGGDPLFVNERMIDILKPFAAGYAEVVVDEEAVAEGQTALRYSELEAPAAAEALGTVAHEMAADALVELIEPML